MRASHPAGYAGAIRCEGGRTARLRAGDWLGLAAAPTFATLALLSGSEVVCGAHGGMALMYGLMAMFHLPAWLKLISRGENHE